MKTTELLEGWGIDLPTLTRFLDEQVGNVAMVVGGSLADDLGGPWSDIDVYAYGDVTIGSGLTQERRFETDSGAPRRAFGRLRGAEIDVQVIPVAPLSAIGAQLRLLLAPEAISALPSIAPNYVPALHALSNGIPINARDLDGLRTASAADLLGRWLAVRAVLALETLIADATAMIKARERLAPVFQLRMAAESAIDGLLGGAGYFHPNPKWRTHLALRGVTEGIIPLSSRDIVAALFPDASDVDSALVTLQRVLAPCVAALAEDPLLRGYPAVDELPRTWRRFRQSLRVSRPKGR